MLPQWLAGLSEGGDLFNLFRYITFRAGGAMITALTISLLLGGRMIAALAQMQGEGQPIREGRSGPARGREGRDPDHGGG